MKEYKKLEDKELIKLFLDKKDGLAYQEIYDRYFSAIKHFVGPIIKKDALKEDLTQDIFIKVFEKIHQYKFEYKFLNLIYKIATNTAIDFMRKEGKMNTLPIEKSNEYDEIYTIQIPDTSLTPIQVFIMQQRVDFLNTILNSLEKPLKKLITKKFIKEETYKELSKEMKIPANTLKTWVSRAKQNFRNTYDIHYINY